MKKKTLTKAELSEALYKKLGYTKQMNKGLVDSAFDLIENSLLQGRSVKIYGFGKFALRDKKNRQGRNPQTGETITISSRRVLTFKPSAALRKKFKA